MNSIKLYTEAQVMDAIRLCDKYGYCVYADAVDIIKTLTPIEIPSDDEINKEARVCENYNDFMTLEQSCEASGRFHGFKQGVKWILNKLEEARG